MGHKSTTPTPVRTAPDPASEATLYVPLAVGGERLSLHERTIRRAIARGELPGYKFGKALRVRLDELDTWAESKAMPDPRTLRPVKAGAKS